MNDYLFSWKFSEDIAKKSFEAAVKIHKDNQEVMKDIDCLFTKIERENFQRSYNYLAKVRIATLPINKTVKIRFDYSIGFREFKLNPRFF